MQVPGDGLPLFVAAADHPALQSPAILLRLFEGCGKPVHPLGHGNKIGLGQEPDPGIKFAIGQIFKPGGDDTNGTQRMSGGQNYQQSLRHRRQRGKPKRRPDAVPCIRYPYRGVGGDMHETTQPPSGGDGHTGFLQLRRDQGGEPSGRRNR